MGKIDSRCRTGAIGRRRGVQRGGAHARGNSDVAKAAEAGVGRHLLVSGSRASVAGEKRENGRTCLRVPRVRVCLHACT